MKSRASSLYSGIQVNRKFNQYESTGKLEVTKNVAATNEYQTNFVTHRDPKKGVETSMGLLPKGRTSSFQQLSGRSSSISIPSRQPNILLKELSFFLKILEAKVRFDPELNENYPVKLKTIEQLFTDLNYKLNGRQLNDLYLNHCKAGESFKVIRLIAWVRKNYAEISKRKNKVLYAEMDKSPLRSINRES